MYLAIWAGGAICTVVLVLIAEGVAHLANPSYGDNLLQSPSTALDRSWVFTIVFLFVVWPKIALDLFTGLATGRPLLQVLSDRKRAEQAHETKMEALKDVIIEGIRTCPVEWREVETPIGQMHLLLRHFPTGSRITHVAIVPNEAAAGIMTLRGMPDPTENVPLRHFNTVSEIDSAKQACETDERWAALCIPGGERAQREEWRKLSREARKEGWR